MSNLKLIVFLFFLYVNSLFSQNVFHYKWYVNGALREGKLIYEKEIDQAVYIDLVSSENLENIDHGKEIKLEKGESATVVNASTSWNDRYYYKNQNRLKFTEDLLKKGFLINDSTLLVKWTLVDESKQIDGFSCKKAITNFRGRNWEVWYTPDIPMYYGPWKFYGLPGLIVSAKEENEKFWFQLTKIEVNPTAKIPVVDTSHLKKVTLKQYDELMTEFFESDLFSSSKGQNNEPYKRNGVELTYEWE
ncbi:GLPGLI family protein [Empedobacter brevis]|uniref:GLPGLI family protein n=1 Tax=Empedobacter brevis TaxID=247 RepID=A0AAJ1V6Q7_9FLAO|nr:GLPGLI family protein [Empedobacter brevis]MDM1071282.1 GLPGLI family protein [Empedobacter brevis]